MALRTGTTAPSRGTLVASALCLLLLGALGLTGPAAGADHSENDGPATPSAEVAVLYREAAETTAKYEEGRKAVEAQRATSRMLEARLAKERGRLRLFRKDVGRLARAQYRGHDDGLSLTANLLFSDDPETLMENVGLASNADRAVTHLVQRSARAESALTKAERKVRASRKAVEARTAHLASLKQQLDTKLKSAQARLQAQGESAVLAGRCRGATRMAQAASDYPKGPWVTPVQHFVLSAGFGGSGSHWSRGHTGQDFAVGIGTPVRAVGGGRVVRVSCGGPFGIEVVLQHPGGYYTQYAHLSSVAVDQGETVRTGQWIAQSGTTGNSTGPHVHFEVRLTPDYGSAVSPLPWLREHGVPVG
ncbi:M23 family metallopeptidase [Streptomyces sp. SID11385]|uniref:M23 family metallopeptidase n=1 Tax=Streptomyces sp. SID11385 TaxID=2706031 RepID=UPI001EF38539|nr:M23 family metallopeptidase [Streptomyces sp. SID11385]